MLLNSKYTLIILLIHLYYKHCFPSQYFYSITLLKCIRECGNHFQQLANFPDDVCALYGTACSILPYFSLLFQNESHSIRLVRKTDLSAWVSENSSGSYTAGPTMFLLGWKTTRVLNYGFGSLLAQEVQLSAKSVSLYHASWTESLLFSPSTAHWGKSVAGRVLF